MSYLTKIEDFFKQNDVDAISIQNSAIETQNTSLDDLKNYLKHDFSKLFDEIQIYKIKVDDQNQYQNLLSNYENIIKKLDNEYKSMFAEICNIRNQQNDQQND